MLVGRPHKRKLRLHFHTRLQMNVALCALYPLGEQPAISARQTFEAIRSPT